MFKRAMLNLRYLIVGWRCLRVWRATLRRVTPTRIQIARFILVATSAVSSSSCAQDSMDTTTGNTRIIRPFDVKGSATHIVMHVPDEYLDAIEKASDDEKLIMDVLFPKMTAFNTADRAKWFVQRSPGVFGPRTPEVVQIVIGFPEQFRDAAAVHKARMDAAIKNGGGELRSRDDGISEYVLANAALREFAFSQPDGKIVAVSCYSDKLPNPQCKAVSTWARTLIVEYSFGLSLLPRVREIDDAVVRLVDSFRPELTNTRK